VSPRTVLEARPASVALLADAVGRLPDTGRLAADLAATVADAPPGQRDDLLLAAVRAVLPRTRSWLVEHGATREQAEASTADVARKSGRYGFGGTGADWFCAVATARVVAVGRLQFELGARLPDGSRTWAVHVPETGPLDPTACDRSFADAPALLRRLAPDHAADVWSCRSWTLDPGLARVLGPESNLVRFAARFALLPAGPHDASEGDAGAAKFVFGTDLDSARRATATSRLQQAVLDRWGAGGHWTERTGVATVA